MNTRRKTLGVMAALLIVTQLLLLGPVQPAGAAQEDVAMFYEPLAASGAWVDYGDNGPVWYPNGVASDWRPYVDGRWVPTDDGWVFETNETWGWATYHYGNWFPTAEYGWVWRPGSTWYPATVAWRANEEYVGWAPIPPPTYVPPPAFYPDAGYYPGTPLLDLITAPFWVLAGASNFLLGFGAPYAPAYSYYGCGCLAPFGFFPAVPLLTDCFFPFFAPNAFFFFGPSFPFVSRVTNINITNINIFAKNMHMRRIHNGVPPQHILDRHHALRQSVPSQVLAGKRFDVRKADFNQVKNQVGRPNAVAPPKDVPGLKAQIPKAVMVPGKATGPEALKGMKGMELPKSAVKETPQMLKGQKPAPGVTAPIPKGGAPGVTAPTPKKGAPGVTTPAPKKAVPSTQAPRDITPRRQVTPRSTQQQPVWSPQEQQQHQKQQDQLRQRQNQWQQQQQQRMQQPGHPEFQQRQQQLLQQRQMQAPRPAPAPRMAPSPAPAPRPAPSGGGHAPSGGGGHAPAGGGRGR